MIPADPSSEPMHLAPAPNSQSPIANDPFFDYTDLFFFLGLSIPSIFISVLLVRVIRALLPTSTSVQLLVIQSVWYFLLFGSLAALFRIRYHRPFWRSLDWRALPAASAIGCIVAGPLLAVSVGIIGSALRTPEINLPFDQLLSSPATIVFLGVIVVILGPFSEELAFRGFMMPLLIRSLGAAGGIVLTGIIFGCIHGYEYQWSWRHMLLISAAGCVFGWVKYKTGSTMASAFMHSTFNLTQFAAFLVQAHSL